MSQSQFILHSISIRCKCSLFFNYPSFPTGFTNFKTSCELCNMNSSLCPLSNILNTREAKKMLPPSATFSCGVAIGQYYLLVNLFCYYCVVNYFLTWNFWGATTCSVCNLFVVVWEWSWCWVVAVPAEVQQGACGGRDALCRPAQQMKLGQSASLLSLNVLQVETTNQEVFTPDVFRHEVHLRHTRTNR